MGQINRDTFLQRYNAVAPGLGKCGFGESSDVLEYNSSSIHLPDAV
ncbi:hypothetical protein [Dysosmobacter welbionis]